MTRAQHHLNEFHADGMDWLGREATQLPPPITKRFEPMGAKPDRGRFVYYVTEPQIDPPASLSLIIGDAITSPAPANKSAHAATQYSARVTSASSAP